MTERFIEYAQGSGVKPEQSRRGIAAFVCAAASVSGILVLMGLIRTPLGGPIGGVIRGIAPVFALILVACWVAGLILGISGIRHLRKTSGFARAALAMCGGAVLLFGLMILLQY